MFCLGGDLKNINKHRVFLSGAVVSVFLTVFYFYQYLNVFQLSDNPSENKKYVHLVPIKPDNLEKSYQTMSEK